jgi:hypothetical protein
LDERASFSTLRESSDESLYKRHIIAISRLDYNVGFSGFFC